MFEIKRWLVLGSVLAAGALAIACFTTDDAPRPSPEALAAAKIEKVKDDLYIITGGDAGNPDAFSGGNTAVFITATGVVIVDTKFPGWGPVILERIRTITEKPITTIINTHSHDDHTGSNGFFGTAVETVVQENTRLNMSKMDAFSGGNARFLPSRTFKDSLTLGEGKDRIDLYYFGPGHTSGDSFVVFRDLRTIVTGDNFAWKALPYIDRSNGGGVVAHSETLTKAVSGIKDVDTVITGHTPVLTWAEFREYAEFTAQFVEWAKSELKAGKPVDQAAPEYKVPAQFEGYVVTVDPLLVNARTNLQAVYNELKK